MQQAFGRLEGIEQMGGECRMSYIAESVLEVLGAIGGAGVVLAGLAKYLGERWAGKYLADVRADHERQLALQKEQADRMLVELRARYELELTNVRASLEHESTRLLEGLRTELDIAKQRHLKELNDKLDIYRTSAALITDVLADMDKYLDNGLPIPEERLDFFNRRRLSDYACIAMISPQEVLDSYDSLIDHLILVAAGDSPYVWEEVRAKGLRLLNSIRKDIGLNATEVEYKGQL